MPYEPKLNKGNLFRRKKEKTSETQSDYDGLLNVEGKIYWFNGWLNTAKDGSKYLSVSVRPREQQQQQEKLKVVGGTDADPNDEIPF